jgi:hypothetical protein
MKSILQCAALVFALLCMATSSGAQSLSNYVFTSTSSTYTSIIGQGGTTLIFDPGVNSDDDDGYYTSVPVGFQFNYLGTNYSTLACCANGFALLGGTSVSGSSWTPDLAGNSGSNGRPVLEPEGPHWVTGPTVLLRIGYSLLNGTKRSGRILPGYFPFPSR